MSGHACPKRGCGANVPSSMLACRRHWYSLSAGTRAAVWAAYRHEGPGSDAHRAAVLDAVDELNRGAS